MRRDRFTDPGMNGDFLRLVAERVCVRLQIDRDFIHSIEMTELPNLLGDRLAVLLEARIYGEKLPPVTKTHTIEIPADWRQHWKRDHADVWWARWWVRRHPPRLCKETLSTTWDARASYPWLRARTQPVPSDFGQAVFVHLPPQSSYTSEYLGVRDQNL